MELRKKTKSFYVIREINREFVPYDVIGYFVYTYKKLKPKNRPKTFEEFKDFVKKESSYMYWSRCEYEIVISDWPNQSKQEKWDIHKQIMMNHDVVTQILINALGK